MESLRDIPPWLTFFTAAIVAIIGGVTWISTSLSRSRHAMRGEMQKILTALEEDDRNSELRVNRQIDMVRDQLARLERRVDDISRPLRGGD